jgi:hypothetical protein
VYGAVNPRAQPDASGSHPSERSRDEQPRRRGARRKSSPRARARVRDLRALADR